MISSPISFKSTKNLTACSINSPRPSKKKKITLIFPIPEKGKRVFIRSRQGRAHNSLLRGTNIDQGGVGGGSGGGSGSGMLFGIFNVVLRVCFCKERKFTEGPGPHKIILKRTICSLLQRILFAFIITFFTT